MAGEQVARHRRVMRSSSRPLARWGRRLVAADGWGIAVAIWLGGAAWIALSGLVAERWAPADDALVDPIRGALLILATGLFVRVLWRMEEQALVRERSAHQTFESLIDSLSIIVFITADDGRFLWVNRRFEEVTGYAFGDVQGHTPRVLRSGEQPPEVYVHLWRSLEQGLEFRGRMINRRRDGSRFIVDEVITPTVDPATGERRFIAVLTDVTAAAEREQRLAAEARVDPVTGLPNEQAFTEALQRAQADGRGYTVVMVDLVDFDVHVAPLETPAGRSGFRQFAARLTGAAVPGVLFGRLSGERIGALHLAPGEPGAEVDRSGLSRQVREFSRLADEPIEVDGVMTTVPWAAGVVVAAPGESGVRALRSAVLAAHQAREQRVPVIVSDSVGADQHAMAMVVDLRRAILEGGLRVYYQPIMDTDGKTVGFEALARHERAGEVIPPIEFVPLAERYDLVSQLDRAVMGIAVAEMSEHFQRTGRRWHLSSNVSALTLEPDLPSFVLDLLSRYDFSPADLTIEVTESQLLRDLDGARDVLHSLGTMGVGISADDFGTGGAALTYLTDLPLREVKIDRRFVDQIDGTSDRTGRVIVDTVIDLAHRIGLTVVAEGIDRESVATYLRERECDRFQGYLYGRPQPASIAFADVR